MGSVNWVTLPVSDGKPSRNCAQELDGLPLLMAVPPLSAVSDAVEAESAARRAERSALRLEVIERVLVVFEAEADVVRALDLGHVDVAGVLVVAELERAAGIGVADVGDARDLEARNALIVRTDAVGARNVQHVGSVIAVLRVAVGADVLPRVAHVAVHQERGRNGVGETGSGHLDAAAGVTGIAAVKRVAAGRSQTPAGRRCPWEKAVTAPDHGFLRGVVVDLPIPAVHGCKCVAP